MKIVEFNAVPYGSTGRIARQITTIANQMGHEAVFAYAWTKKKKNNCAEDEWIVTPFLSRAFHLMMQALFGLDGLFSRFSTKRFIRRLKKFKPDLIHLHITHSGCINHKILFEYIKKENIQVVWTFHDCWAFSGCCTYVASEKCNKWKDGCEHCSLARRSRPYGDFAKRTWKYKKACYNGVKNMDIVTPSNWLASLVKESICKEHTVRVIHNGIDLNVFRPTESDFRQKYGIEGKMLLGVAFAWGERKGLDVIIDLAKQLSEKDRIVLVGADQTIARQLPSNIIPIYRTENQQKLAEIYTAADVFINPTREDNFPTVNLEALACGTPVITFQTGGSPECIDETCGLVTEENTVDGLMKAIHQLEENPIDASSCRKRAMQFDKDDKYREYVQLFESKTV